MLQVIDYPAVLQQMQKQGFRCHYYNSGAFGFADPSAAQVVGWSGPDDLTIRPEMRPHVRQAPPPWEKNLTKALIDVWRRRLPGPVWVMPRSHWAHELHHGSSAWMAELLEQIGVDSAPLARRADAAAIAFAPEESEPLAHFVWTLLKRLEGSDFTLGFPGRPVLCTLHHHKQIWWMTSDAALAEELNLFP